MHWSNILTHIRFLSQLFEFTKDITMQGLNSVLFPGLFGFSYLFLISLFFIFSFLHELKEHTCGLLLMLVHECDRHDGGSGAVLIPASSVHEQLSGALHLPTGRMASVSRPRTCCAHASLHISADKSIQPSAAAYGDLLKFRADESKLVLFTYLGISTYEIAEFVYFLLSVPTEAF